MKKTKLTKEELEKISCREHFYSWLKSAEDSWGVEGNIKFNYRNIVDKLEPELIDQIESKVMAQLRREEEVIKYPFGGGPSVIGVYLKFDPPGTNLLNPRPDFEMYKYPHNSADNPDREIGIAIYKFLNLGKNKPNKTARERLNSLFNLCKLEYHIKDIVKEIEKSELRNYTGTHSAEVFKEEVIFKIYRGQEQIYRLKTESIALNFFQKKLPELNTPRVYCHGELGNFYVLLEEKISGMTSEQFFKENKNAKKKNTVLRNIIKNLVDIHQNGKDLDTTYGKIDEKKCLEWFKAGFIDRLRGYNLNLESLIRNYSPIAKQLSNYEVKTLNKDANLKNWIITDNSKIHAIDFENTGIRPPQLDLVQLLEDKSLNLKRKDKEELKKYYIQRFNEKGDASILKINDYETFNKVYHCALLHRYLVNIGFSSEKFKISNPEKCKHLQTENLNSCLNSLKYLIDNRSTVEEKEQYTNLYSVISNLKKEIQNYKS